MLKPFRLLAYFLPLLAFLLFAPSCNTFDPLLTVPVYGHIDSIHLIDPTDSMSEYGSASSSIPYAWVYLDDNPVGAFQMPCTFPMVASNGTHTIQVYPAVIPVGGTSPAFIYPFYQYYTTVINMQQGNTYKIKPVIHYFSWVHAAYMMNFDNFSPGSPPINNGKYSIINYYGGGNKSGATTTQMEVIGKPQAFQGLSGMVVVNQAHPYYIGMTWPGDTLSFNNSNIPVYMELNYKATTLFAMGLFDNDTTSQSGPLAIVYPTTTWKKMYVALNNYVYPNFRGIPQNIYFTITWDSTDNHQADTLLLDNIKIFY